MSAQEWLEELKRLEERATPGPWCNPGRAYVVQQYGAEEVVADCKSKQPGRAPKDAAWIVAACNAVPKLVEMLRIAVSIIEARNVRETLQGEMDMTCDVMQLLFDLTEPKE